MDAGGQPRHTAGSSFKGLDMHARLLALAFAVAPLAAAAAPPSKVRIGETVYEHRWSDGDFHEFTPTGQDDLDRYSEMITLPPSPAGRTAADLERYTDEKATTTRTRGGEVLSQRCEPATPTHVPDCTLLVVYAKPDHVELAVSKHMAAAGTIVPVLFAHREYGEGAGQRAQAWMASPAGQRMVADFIDWADAMGLGIERRWGADAPRGD